MNNKLIEKLYQYLEHDVENAYDDYKNDYLTEATGRNKRDYYWYLDEHNNVLIDVLTEEIIDDEKFIEEQFC